MSFCFVLAGDNQASVSDSAGACEKDAIGNGEGKSHVGDSNGFGQKYSKYSAITSTSSVQYNCELHQPQPPGLCEQLGTRGGVFFSLPGVAF